MFETSHRGCLGEDSKTRVPCDGHVVASKAKYDQPRQTRLGDKNNTRGLLKAFQLFPHEDAGSVSRGCAVDFTARLASPNGTALELDEGKPGRTAGTVSAS